MARVFGFGVVGVALLGGGLFLLWAWLFPVPAFPVPSGPFAIGTHVYHWIDPSRPEPFTADPADRRELVVQVWYPAAPTSGPLVPYLDDIAVRDAIAARLHVPGWLLVNLQNAPTHAVRDAAPAAGGFPVLLNPTGYSGFRDASLFWIEDLVSHGYVVVGLDQPGTAATVTLSTGTVVTVEAEQTNFSRYMPLALQADSVAPPPMNGVPLPSGIIPFIAGDLSFVADRLAVPLGDGPGLGSHLDLDRLGVFGMSLGGYVGTEACRQDARFKACLAVDSGYTAAVSAEGLSQPVLIMSRDADIMRLERQRAGGWPEPEIAHTVGDERALFARSRGGAIYVTMNRMFHVNWTDAPLWSPLVGWIGLAGPIEPAEGHRQTSALTLAFFDQVFAGRTSKLLAAGSPLPDVTVETRAPL